MPDSTAFDIKCVVHSLFASCCDYFISNQVFSLACKVSLWGLARVWMKWGISQQVLLSLSQIYISHLSLQNTWQNDIFPSLSLSQTCTVFPVSSGTVNWELSIFICLFTFLPPPPPPPPPHLTCTSWSNGLNKWYMTSSSVLVTEWEIQSQFRCHKMMQKHLVFVSNSLKFQNQMKAKWLGIEFPIYFIVRGLGIVTE